jgi:hypothetical protein
MQFDSNGRRQSQSEAKPLDPVALALALWLGLVVGVTGLMRLSDAASVAAMHAAIAQVHGP